MSCFGFSTNTREDEEYREKRRKAQIEHKSVFRYILNTLVIRARNRERRIYVEEIDKGDLKLLDRIRYFKVLKSSFQDVDFDTEKMEEGKLELKGRGSSFDDAYDRCSKQLQDMNIIQESFSLNMDEKWKWDIIATFHCQEYFDETMSAENIMAEVCINFSNYILSKLFAFYYFIGTKNIQTDTRLV